jgi:hypothetical protein
MSGVEWDYTAQASRRLADLDEIALKAGTLDNKSTWRVQFDAFVNATRAVLESLIEIDTRTASG